MRILIILLLLISPQSAGARVDRGPLQGQAVYQRQVLGAMSSFVRRGAWEVSRWTSPERVIGFAADELVPSWTADTPPGSWLKVELRVPGSGWYVMGRWAYGDSDIKRTSVSGQADGFGRVAVDVFEAVRPVTRYSLRATLYRRPGSAVRPELRSLGLAASSRGVAAGPPQGVAASAPADQTAGVGSEVRPAGGVQEGVAWGTELKVPRKAQGAHAGHGGKAWCAPTSTAMVVAYWGRGPSRAETAWVRRGDPDPLVDHAAEHIRDRAYGGTGNWAFNAAYAGSFGLDALVARLTSLDEVERLVAAGIPVVTSQSFTRRELGYDTDGHLMVVVGFTAQGDVIANDPAVRRVRVVYPRETFEKVWLRTGVGTAYVIRPPERPLPAGLLTE